MRTARAIVAVSFLALLPAASRISAQEEDLLLRLQPPAIELRTGTAFDAAVLLDAAIPGVQGWSLGVTHPPTEIELLEAVEGSATLTAKAGAEPDFWVLNEETGDPPGVTLAVVISFRKAITLGPGTGYELLKMRYRAIADPAAAGPCEPIQTGIHFSDAVGAPPVSNIITVEGSSRTPATRDATVTVRCPGSLEIIRCEGDTENIYLEWTFGGAPTWDFLFLYRDAELLASLDPAATSYTDEALEPGDYEYTLVTFVVEDPSSPTLIFGHCVGTVIPVTLTSIEPTLGYYVGGDEVLVTGTAFTTAETTSLVFFDESITLPLTVLEVTSETEIRARTPASPRLGRYGLRIENERGSAELPDAFEYGFIRGEANGDGSFDISDGVFILDFLFRGTSTPACLDACDVTDDGQVDISDAIRVFGFLFLGGGPPPAPFPGPGSDRTADPLGCLE